MFVPQFVPHREENPEPHEPAVMIIARSTQGPIMSSYPSSMPRRNSPLKTHLFKDLGPQVLMIALVLAMTQDGQLTLASGDDLFMRT